MSARAQLNRRRRTVKADICIAIISLRVRAGDKRPPIGTFLQRPARRKHDVIPIFYTSIY